MIAGALLVAALASTSSTATAAIDLHHRAVLSLIGGQRKEARLLLEELRARYPAHPLAGRVPELLSAMEAAEAFAPARLPPGGPRLLGERLAPPRTLGETLRDEKPSGLARAFLATGQTMLGAALGAEVCAIADCSDVRPVVGSLILGGGAALTFSLLLTQDGITLGRALMLNSAGIFGLWHGVAIMAAVQPDESRVYWGGVAAGQVLGLGIGVLLGPVLDPSAGDVIFASSTALWGTAVAAFSFAAVGFRSAGDPALFATLLAATDAGLLAGALLSRVVPMSVGRVMIIDLGGLLGGALGMGIDALAQGAEITSGPFSAAAIAGSVLGLATAGWLSRDWDLPELPVTVGLVPVGRGLGVAAGFRF